MLPKGDIDIEIGFCFIVYVNLPDNQEIPSLVFYENIT